MNRPPWWLWVGAVAVLLVGTVVFVSGIMRTQYYIGVADSAEAEALNQSVLIGEAEVVVDSLTSVLRGMEEEALVHAREDSIRLEGLRSTRARSSRQADSLAVELEARLDSVQAIQLRELVAVHEVELTTVQGMLTIEREVSAREALRANQASLLVFQLETQVTRLEGRDLTRLLEIEALREASGGIGFSINTSWVTGVGGLVAGIVLANWLQGTP